MSALVVGGSGDGGVKPVTGVAGLLEFLIEDANFSTTTPGAPIAYTMRYLKDNSVASIVLNSEYTIRNCEEKGEERTLTPAPVTQPYDGCPVLYHGDNQFGGTGVKVKGKISLKISGDKKAVLATIYYDFNEPMDDYNNADTRAEIKDEEIVAYELSKATKTTTHLRFYRQTRRWILLNPHRRNHHPQFHTSQRIIRPMARDTCPVRLTVIPTAL